MTPEQRNFVRSLLHRVLNSAVTAVIFRLPTVVLLLLIAAAVAAVWYFELY